MNEEQKEYNDVSPLKCIEKDRYVMFPILFDDIWSLYKKAVASFWTPEEIDLNDDIKHYYKKLNQHERNFINNILAFFAAADGIVAENIAINFYEEITIPEIRAFYGFQISTENIHNETYSMLIDTLVPNECKDSLFEAAELNITIKQKADWAKKYLSKRVSFQKRLFAWACVEFIHFSASFCAIFWLKKRGLMPGLTFSNELISRDEGLHCDFGALLYTKYLKEDRKLNYEEIIYILKDAVKTELDFVDDSLKVDLIGMNKDLMKQYVFFIADQLLVKFGYEKYYNIENPFEWMITISLQGKTNFFERKVSEYRKAGKKEFKLDESF